MTLQQEIAILEIVETYGENIAREIYEKYKEQYGKLLYSDFFLSVLSLQDVGFIQQKTNNGDALIFITEKGSDFIFDYYDKRKTATNKPIDSPPLFLGFSFHLGTLTRPGYFKFETGSYMFNDIRHVNYQVLTVSKFYGLSFREKWFIGFTTFSKAQHINEIDQSKD